MILLLLACREPELEFHSELDDAIGVWWTSDTEEEGIVCGVLEASGEAYGRSEARRSGEKVGPVSWRAAGPYEVEFLWSGFVVGSLSLEPLAPDLWAATYGGVGYSHVELVATPGCGLPW